MRYKSRQGCHRTNLHLPRELWSQLPSRVTSRKFPWEENRQPQVSTKASTCQCKMKLVPVSTFSAARGARGGQERGTEALRRKHTEGSHTPIPPVEAPPEWGRRCFRKNSHIWLLQGNGYFNYWQIILSTKTEQRSSGLSAFSNRRS